MDRYAERRPSGRRAGFTLIELLVVICIIAILAALTTGAVMRFMGSQPIANTRNTVTKVNSLLKKKWTEVTEQARKEPMDPTIKAAAQADGGGDSERERVIYIKIRQRQAFPETFAEAISGFTVGGVAIPGLPAYVAQLKKYGITTGNNASPAAFESSVCLLMAVKRSVAGGGVTDEDVGKDTINTTVATGGAPCLVDAWGNPLAFTRWPLGNSMAPAASPDPTDPLGKLSNATWQASAGGKDFIAKMHALSSSKVSPAVASMGPKGGVVLEIANPGLATHWQETNTNQSGEIIYSFNLP